MDPNPLRKWISISSFILFLPYYYVSYHSAHIEPQLHGLQYSTNAISWLQASDYQVERCEQITSKGL